jgi:hypothetical protein
MKKSVMDTESFYPRFFLRIGDFSLFGGLLGGYGSSFQVFYISFCLTRGLAGMRRGDFDTKKGPGAGVRQGLEWKI